MISRDGRAVRLDQIGHSEVTFEEPIMKRRDRTSVITIRSDINEATQPPEVSQAVMTALQPLIASLPVGYRIEMGGNIEESLKANVALVEVFPLMIAAMLIVIILQVRSLSTMTMVMLTAPLGLAGAVPALLLFNQPFGFNAILGLIGLAGILMRNTLILTEQIKDNKAAGLDDYHAVIEATVQRTRPVILTALAGLLGVDGLHAHRRHGGRHGDDPAFPSGTLCRLVPDQTDRGQRDPSRPRPLQGRQ